MWNWSSIFYNRYNKRVLLKLSGEALAGEKKTGVDVETVGKICDKIKEVVEMGVEVALEAGGVYSRVQTAIEMREIAEPFIIRKAEKHLEKGRVVIFSCGTGHPYFTTDTAAVLRATEIQADIILLGKAIDAVYSADPKLDANAEKYDKNLT